MDSTLFIIIVVAVVASAIIVAIAVVVGAVIVSKRNAGGGHQSLGGIVLEAPQSESGYPVEPSGITVDDDTPLRRGSTVLSFSQGRWWRAEVIAIEPKGYVKIRYPGWDSKWDVSLHRTELQVDISGSASPD